MVDSIGLPLVGHRDNPESPVDSIRGSAVRNGARLSLRWQLAGNVQAIVLPEAAPSRRADALWDATCAEAFIAPVIAGTTGDLYVELNVSPSTQWAAYRFDGYRHGQKSLAVAAPVIASAVSDTALELRASFLMPSSLSTGDWTANLSMIVVDRLGGKSYWALAHPDGQPDFHDRSCFGVALAPSHRP